MMQRVKGSGFVSGDGLIDMTGQSPSISFLIGAKPMGDSWLLGGYSGSNEYAVKKLNQLSCQEKVNSYLLVEPDGPLSLDIKYVLKEIGLGQNKYSPATNWATPRGAGGFLDARQLFLLKPDKTAKFCQ
jgi:hypothetical protein